MKLRKGLPTSLQVGKEGTKRRTKRRIRLDRYYRMSKLDLQVPLHEAKKKTST